MGGGDQSMAKLVTNKQGGRNEEESWGDEFTMLSDLNRQTD